MRWRLNDSNGCDNRDTDLNSNDVIFKYKGENYSKNQYFFGETKQKEQKEVTFRYIKFSPNYFE